ncbi:MAG TPA: TIGR03943 family protein [Chthoniobacteraceae bacterium]|nr:TIGR03943 family protein [Chthoniobacteraceae bacterium]
MTKLFARWLPFATLATWSAVLLYFYVSGRLDAFLHPMFRPYVLIAGSVLALMAIVFVFAPAEASCCGADSCGHTLTRHSAGKLLTFFVLLIPIGVASFFSTDSFGKTMIQNRRIDSDGSTLPARPRVSSPARSSETSGIENKPAAQSLPPASAAPSAATVVQDPLPEYLQRTADGAIIAEVLDLLYAAQDSVLRKDFEGRKVQLVGQLMPDPTTSDSGAKRFKTVRMFMTCCAADARPVATLVQVKDLPDLPEMTWIKVIGKSTFPVEKGRRTAVLEAERVEKTDPPEEAMLY